MEICSKYNCTGCQLCADVCPVSAISYKEDDKGFLHPYINDKCIHCNLCIQKCPENNLISNLTQPKKIYACWNSNTYIKKKSTSGGLFFVLAKKIIDQNGVVFGASWKTKDSVEHICVDKVEDLQKLQKSKYVQSNTINIYKKLREVLKVYNCVLFSGTPCQIAAVKSFLTKSELSKVILVEVICHGIPNEKLLKDHLLYLESKYNKKVKDIDFRYKSKSWEKFSVKVTFEDGEFKLFEPNSDPYFNLFNMNYSLRESCYQCKYSNIHRNSDITLGDFWNYYPLHFKMRKYDQGVSLIMLNTDKGSKLFESIKDDIVFEKRSLNDAFLSNQSLTKCFSKNLKYDFFWNKYLNSGYDSAIQLLNLKSNKIKPTIIIKFKSFIKYHLYYFPRFIQRLLLRK